MATIQTCWARSAIVMDHLSRMRAISDQGTAGWASRNATDRFSSPRQYHDLTTAAQYLSNSLQTFSRPTLRHDPINRDAATMSAT